MCVSLLNESAARTKHTVYYYMCVSLLNESAARTKHTKQLLTFVEVDMLFCRPRKSDIDRDGVEVNITFQGSAKQHIDRNKS